MAIIKFVLTATALLMQISVSYSIRRSFGSSMAMVGGDSGSFGVINHSSGVKVLDPTGNAKVLDGGNVVIIGENAPGVKVHNIKKGPSGNVKVIEGGNGQNVVYFGDDGHSMMYFGNNGGGVGMVSGGVSGVSTGGSFGGVSGVSTGGTFGSVGNFGGVGVFSGSGASAGGVRRRPGGVSVVSRGPGFVGSNHVAVSPFGAGAFAGASAGGLGAYNDAGNLLNFVTSATGIGLPFF